MHVSSLPGDYSIGSLGSEALEFIDFLSECKFSVWQVLPFGMTDAYNSPYKSSASFGANPFFIDLRTLCAQSLITEEELAAARQKSPYLSEFSRLWSERIDLLSRAAGRADSDTKDKVAKFIKENPYIASAARFLALLDKNGGRPWQEFEFDTPDEERLFMWQFVQYEFYSQWMRVKMYANEKGISIIGDLPIYVDINSADVYSDPQLFQLDKNGYPTAVAGVPPDAFSADGQLWGNPLYNWQEMKKDGYSWWKARISHALTLFDGIRIDHFRAIEAYWSIPQAAESAKEGKWVRGPGRALIDAIRSVSGDKLIIAEDLGVITPRVKSLLKYSRFPGMRVFQFGFADEGENPHLPHNYPENSVSYTGTHDNNTLLGFLYECDANVRERVYDYCSAPRSGEIRDSVEYCIKSVLASHSARVIFPIQDVFGFGADTRMNTPGVATGNWAYRITREQLLSVDRAKFARLNTLYGRGVDII